MNRRMQEVSSFVLVMIIVLSFLTGCATVGEPPMPPPGQIVPLSTGTVLNGITKAIFDKPDTFRYMKDQMFVLGFYVKNIPAFVCFSSQGISCSEEILNYLSGGGGNGVNPKTMQDLRDYLNASGWTSISGSELPKCIQVLAGATVSYVANISQSFVTVLLIPAGILDPSFIKGLESAKG